MRLVRHLKAKFQRTPLSVMYRWQLAICRFATSITFLVTCACLLVDAPVIAAVPWAVMFGMASTGWALYTLLLETQRQIETYLENDS